MKKGLWFISFIMVFGIAGCFDTVEETTISENGGGVLVNSLEMGKMLTIMKNMGDANTGEMKDIDKLKIDTIINIKDIKDSLVTLSDAEKKMLEEGNVHFIINYEDEKFSITFTVPFAQPADIIAVTGILKKSRLRIMSDQMDKVFRQGGSDESLQKGNDDGTPDISDYFDFGCEIGKMTKKLNKEKYANLENDKSLKSLQEMGQLGMPVNFRSIINLPKAAKKAEGKGLSLSEDRKKITIEGNLDDFYEDPSKFEYEIEY